LRNESLVENGLAWHYNKYSDDRNLKDAELRAKAEGVGVWRKSREKPGHLAVTQAPTYGVVSGAKSAGIIYHGNRKSRKFHKPSCRHYNCKSRILWRSYEQ